MSSEPRENVIVIEIFDFEMPTFFLKNGDRLKKTVALSTRNFTSFKTLIFLFFVTIAHQYCFSDDSFRVFFNFFFDERVSLICGKMIDFNHEFIEGSIKFKNNRKSRKKQIHFV